MRELAGAPQKKADVLCVRFQKHDFDVQETCVINVCEQKAATCGTFLE